MNTPPRPPRAPDRPAMLDVEQARDRLLAAARGIEETETVELAAALGRVLAADLVAGLDVPGFDNSAMDGYAVRSVDLAAAGVTELEVAQTVTAGAAGVALEPGQAARIFTGAPLPEGADAVVMQEDCERDGARVRFSEPVAAGKWVRPRGNNVARGATVLPAGCLLRPQELGIAAAIGCAGLTVRRRPRVSVLSSGDELVAPGEPLPAGGIYDSNGATLGALLAASGWRVVRSLRLADDPAATREALLAAAADSDLILSSGGVSVGEADHLKAALQAVGELRLWRVAVKPGKPLVHGRVGEADFLGLPGNPVSVLVTFCLFVRPFVLRRLGVRRLAAPWLPVRAAFDWPTAGTRREYLRVRLERAADGGVAAALHPRQGSDVLASALWADGLVEVRERRSFRAGETLPFASFSELLGACAA